MLEDKKKGMGLLFAIRYTMAYPSSSSSSFSVDGNDDADISAIFYRRN